jgi:DNA-binding response OmpR family regulator
MNQTADSWARARKPAHETKVILLVVVNDRTTRSMLHWMLNKRGYHTLLAGSAEQALAMTKVLGSEFFSVLMTDVNLPGMDGIELAAKLRAIRPGLKTVFVSAMPKERFAELAAGALQAVFVPKPFNADELDAALRGLWRADGGDTGQERDRAIREPLAG